MSGMYGTVKPADIDIENDVEIFYHYRPSYGSDDTNFNDFKKLETKCLSQCTGGESSITISGLFNLKLPLKEFNKKGIYTIYIRPMEEKKIISDIGVLAAFPDVRGVVFNDLTDKDYTGYRIEYLSNGVKNGNFKIITSSNKASATTTSIVPSNGIKYYFNNSGSFHFCTVTPSLAPTYKANSLPNIGNPGQEVMIVNTKFNPVMIEIEMVNHDADTLTTMIEGDQLIDKDRALITTFNEKGEIYHQSEFGVYKDSYGNPLYEFKKNRDNIDFNQSLDNLEE